MLVPDSISRKKGLIISLGVGLFLAVFSLVQIIRLVSGAGEPINEVESSAYVRVYLSRNDHFFWEIASTFEEETGIRVELVVSSASGAVRKILAEKDQDSGTVDLLILEDNYPLYTLIEADTLSPNLSPLRKNKPGDNSHFLPEFIPLYKTCVRLLYNKTQIEDPPRDWVSFNEFLVRQPGRFGFTAVNGATSFSFLYAAHKALSQADEASFPSPFSSEPSLLKNWLQENGGRIILTNSDYDARRLLSTGKLYLTLAMEDEFLRARTQHRVSDDVEIFLPHFGTTLHTYGMVLPQNTPRRNEAEEFIRFLTSGENQEKMRERLLVYSLYPELNPPEGIPGGDEYDFLPDLKPEEKQEMIDLFRKEFLYN